MIGDRERDSIRAMPFPVRIDDRLLEPPALAAWLAGLPEGAAGEVSALIDSGQLTLEEAAALAGSFLSQPDARLLSEGARVAVRVGDRRLGPILLHALDAFDPAVWLQPDPDGSGRSVEDTLLGAAVGLAGPDPVLRQALLQRMRNAGLPDHELALLCAHGSAAELRRWLPAILSEGVPSAAIPAVTARLARGDEGSEVLREALAIAGALTIEAVQPADA